MPAQTTQGTGTGSASRYLVKTPIGISRSKEKPERVVSSGVVTIKKMKIFQSTELTGNGTFQNIAHGLDQIPIAVVITITSTEPVVVAGPSLPGQQGGVVSTPITSFRTIEGEHTNTNLIIRVTNNVKYKVLAFA
jgi:hypothetical protein